MYKDDKACPKIDDPKLLPIDTVPAMAYVPFQQWNDRMSSPETALEQGTLFPVLHKPFKGRGVEKQ